MAELIAATRTRIESSEPLRVAALSALAALLAVVFLALLISDQVHAASF
jgi:hypothetical protein